MSKNFINTIHFVLILTTIIGCIVSLSSNNQKWLIPFLTIPMINIALIPYSYKAIRQDFFNPFLTIIASLTIGTVLRSFFIVSPLQSPTKHLMLMGNNPSILSTGIIHIYFGIIFVTLGFLVCGNKKYHWENKSIFKAKFDRKKIIKLTITLSLVSLAAAFLYMKAMGLNLFTILASDNISSKRFLQLEEGGFSSLVYYRKLMDFSKFSLFLLLIFLLTNKSKKPDMLIILLMIMTGGLGIFFNFINSNRGAAGTTIITVFIIIYYVMGKIPKKVLLPGVAIVLALLITMTFLRRERSNRENVEREDPFTIVVGSLNFLGVGKASYIGENVPEKMDYQYGQTLILWCLAPIPRTLWKNKPEISIGRVIGEKIYEKRDENSKAGGVPPGLITELYMNFAIPGIIVGMFVFGFYIRKTYNSLYSMRAFSGVAILIYVLVVRDFIGIISGDLSRGVVDLLSTLIPLILFVKIVKK